MLHAMANIPQSVYLGTHNSDKRTLKMLGKTESLTKMKKKKQDC